MTREQEWGYRMIVRDEVCGMEFPLKRAAASLEFQGKVYCFCAERCRVMFQKSPHWYVPVSEEVQRSD